MFILFNALTAIKKKNSTTTIFCAPDEILRASPANTPHASLVKNDRFHNNPNL
jgi:hypothetical protein